MPRKPPGPDTKLTPGDEAVLNYITAYTAIHGRPPSLRDVANGRGHTSHGPTQRSVNALVAVGKLQRKAGGAVQVPGLTLAELALAEIVGGTARDWISAPAAGLIAWRVDADFEDFRIGDVAFVRPGTAEKGDLVLAVAEGRRRNRSGYAKPVLLYSLQRVSGIVRPGHHGHFVDDRQRGPAIDFIGPVRYLQRELNGAEQAEAITPYG